MGVQMKPFKAVRPKKEFVAQVAALPYDVMNTEEARVMAKGNPHSFLRVDKAEIDLPEGTDQYSQTVYDKARENLQELMQNSMEQDAQENLYIYRLTGYGCTQTGLAACLSVEEYHQGLIKKHEFTRPEKEIDRINHMKACEAHTGPIFVAYRTSDSDEPRKIMAEFTRRAATYDFTAEDGVRHEMWVVDDIAVQNALRAAFDKIPNLYIADGHHRNATALKVAQERNEKNNDPLAEHNFYIGVVFPDTELKILDYNRVVKDFNGTDLTGFLDKIASDWIVEKSDTPVKPDKKFEVGMYTKGQWYKLELKSKPDLADTIGSLDCSVLQDRLLAPVLGIADPKTDKRIDFVGGIRGLSGLEERVDSGEMAVAFALFPTSMNELMAVADNDQIMPPKSTWFEPKLRSGLLVHLF